MANRKQGFTFIEVLLVVSVMAVLMAVSAPKMGATFRSTRIKTAARDLTAVLRYARHVAIIRRGGCQVVFDPNEARYQLQLVEIAPDGELYEIDDDDQLDEIGEGDYRVSAEARRIRRLPDRVYFNLIHTTSPLTDDSDLPRVVFYPDGSASASSIGLQDEDDNAFAIAIYRTTGMARVGPGRPILAAETQPLYYKGEYEFGETYRVQ